MKFRNKEGKELKTIMSDDIVNQIAEITESELIKKDIFYLRDGTKFNVKQSDVTNLLNAQLEASKKLLDKGVITLDMLIQDFKANF